MFDKQRKTAMNLNAALARSMADSFNKTTSVKHWARGPRRLNFSSEEEFNFARHKRML
jgi:hypothetical protein